MTWTHATSVSLPFTHHVWEHICKVVKRTGSREEHEAELALALDAFLKRAARKEKLSATERRVVAKSRAAGAVPVPQGELNVLDVPAPSFGLAGVYTEPDLDDDTAPDEDDDFADVLNDGTVPGPAATGCGLLAGADGEDQWLP
ncbi:hypothetical protein STAFG_0356 [Streptomyces afghaniensis 772]|uniref:Uncharacterized protein n=1 Tax=Streptomyces afghaniensis 772 TaxID=1283301 RepID=S4MZB0_9ACTN|nr:hypothetical protein [Streptomyces afghaniensis]EPJ42581.1 hypothetical protein STAFG_0356 [Streptomyces afghaniensis 772]